MVGKLKEMVDGIQNEPQGDWSTNRTWGNTNSLGTNSQVSEGPIQNSQNNCDCDCDSGNLPF